MNKPNKIELTKVTNELFKLFILDLMETKQVRQIDIAKATGLNKQFVNNKLKGYSNNYVTLPTIFLICERMQFNFDLNKYSKQLQAGLSK